MRGELLDAFRRAAADCLHPRVIAMSIVPLLIVGGGAALLGWFFWEPALGRIRTALDGWTLMPPFGGWLESIGGPQLRSVLAALAIVLLAVPAAVVASLVIVAMLMTPAIVNLVASRRFPGLERREGAGFGASVAWSLACTAVALFVLVVSIPLWFVPPLVLVVPPLIWGWLTYKVFAFDVLAAHASRDERQRLVGERRTALFAMGVATGYLGAAPSLIWALGALTLVFAPVLLVVSVWLYTLVFAFSALWFAHYLLAALRELRAGEPPL